MYIYVEKKFCWLLYKKYIVLYKKRSHLDIPTK